jgi:type I restriction enzyme S subunit
MKANLKPYPKYKESGLPWLGKMPVHWDIGRNGRLFAQRNENGFGELPILEVSLRTGVRVRDMDNLKRKRMMSDLSLSTAAMTEPISNKKSKESNAMLEECFPLSE